MGIKNTFYITRATALSVLYNKLEEVSDDDLTDMLEDFPESHFRNYRIICEEDLEELYDFEVDYITTQMEVWMISLEIMMVT